MRVVEVREPFGANALLFAERDDARPDTVGALDASIAAVRVGGLVSFIGFLGARARSSTWWLSER